MRGSLGNFAELRAVFEGLSGFLGLVESGGVSLDVFKLRLDFFKPEMRNA
jgi:hypothetical protein